MKEINYEDAMRQLEETVQKMESGQLNVDSLSKELKTAQELIKLCREKLMKTEGEIQAIMQDSPLGAGNAE